MTKFIRKNAVMVISFIAALVTSFIIAPNKEYLNYFDFKTLACLFCVLCVVCALKNINFFYMLARRVVQFFKTTRMSILALIYITFIGSMLGNTNLGLYLGKIRFYQKRSICGCGIAQEIK